VEREAKKLGEQLLDSYGPRAFDWPRSDLADLLEVHGLDHEDSDVSDLVRHMEWLWEEE
jgi:hypothetical protein